MKTLYRLQEFPDIWADACLRDSSGRLIFLSVYGRDGVLMQMLSAIELGRSSERGVDRINLLDPDGQRHRADVGDAKRLAKHSGKLPKQNLFGSLNQMWLYDRCLQTPDRANRIGWVLHSLADAGSDDGDTVFQERIWRLINLLSPVALQDHWRELVVAWLVSKSALEPMDSALYPALGRVRATRVSLSDQFTDFISQSVGAGAMRLDESAQAMPGGVHGVIADSDHRQVPAQRWAEPENEAEPVA